jgi:aminoglycoside phosphotransferase (APT) family kinase protein
VKMHAGQLTVSVQTVRALLGEQFPQWRGLPVTSVESPGTVNAIFRIGERLGARFPLQPGDVDATRRWLESEAEAARELAGRTRFPTPEPVAIGEPGAGYPLPWSVQTWLPGVAATPDSLRGSHPAARELAEFITAVRAIDTRGRKFRGSGRGGKLADHDPFMADCFEHSEQLLDVPRLRRMWASMRTLPRRTTDVMNHGDLVPGNVLAADGHLTGILDVGGLKAADPALDLVGAWHLFDAGPRQAFRDELGCDDLDWERGKAWALQQAIGLVWYYAESNPAMSQLGRSTLARLMADETQKSGPG